MPMVVRELRYRDGRLRARFRSGKWQLPDRVPRHLRDHGKRLAFSTLRVIPWTRDGS